jgi:hypothetical protein
MRVPQVSERIKEAPAQVLRGVFAGIGQLLLYTDKLRNKAPFGQQVPRARVPAPPQTAPSRTMPAESVPDRAAANAPAEQAAAAEPAAAETPSVPKPPRASRAPKTPKIPAAPKTPKAPTAATEIRDFDKTGNVRLITGDEARADDEPTAAVPPVPAVAAAEEPEPVVAAAVEPEPAVSAVEEQAPASPGEPAEGPADSGPPLPNYDELSIASLRARLRNLDVTQVRRLAEYEKGHAGRADVIVMLERRIAKLEAGD